MNKLERLLPLAIEAIEESEVVAEDKIKSQFKGYISSFGASVISSGLLPTIAFYSNQGGAEEKRELLLVAIHTVLRKQGQHLNTNSLTEYVMAETNTALAKRRIFDACIAIKLAIRTFKND